MKNTDKYIWPVFWTAAVVFVLAIFGMIFKSPLQTIMPAMWVILMLAGLVLLVLSIRSVQEKKLKISLAICGAALAAITLFILLHNLTYSLVVQKSQFGIMTFEGNRDEPFFFILAVIVCPIVYLASAVASIILLFMSGRSAG